jgi:outer membrane protein
VFSGGSRVTTDTTAWSAGLAKNMWHGGGNYTVNWTNNRRDSDSQSSTFNPSFGTGLQAQFTQPLLRNFRIDATRAQILTNEVNQDIAEINLSAQVVTVLAQVINAYWELVYARQAVEAAERSLDLASKLVADNRARVEIGTMAPIDIVQAEAEVAQREEAVIVAEAAIARSEDALRALLYGEHATDEWNARLVPTDAATFVPVAVDLQAVTSQALAARTDIMQAQKTLEANDVSIRFLRNQILPDLSAAVDYGATGIGGSQFVRGDGFPGPIIGTINKPYTDVLRNVVGADFPTWTFTLQLSYPLGNSTQDVNLARARLQNRQSAKQLDASKIRVATEVRETARMVTTNGKRVEATRASRALAEKRLEAEEKKFQAGMTTNFFVLQAQRDLNQARNNELQALIDYLKSVVDYETAQVAPLQGGASVNPVQTGGGFNTQQTQQQRQQ